MDTNEVAIAVVILVALVLWGWMAFKNNAPKRITVEEIRKAFPDPSQGPDGYSVGGAFCNYTDPRDSTRFTCKMGLYKMPHPSWFPDDRQLGTGIYWTNHNLTEVSAVRYAHQINVTNSFGDFETAWEILEEALR